MTTKREREDALKIGADSVDGMAAYIMECKVKGIGVTLATKIAQVYRGHTIETIIDHPEDLAHSINGIGKGRAKALHDAMIKRFGPEVEEMKRQENERRKAEAQFWGALKISGWQRRMIENHFGEDAAVELLKDPYRLTVIDGFGFRRADEIAEKFDITGDDPRRIRAGLDFTLEEKSHEGHCCLTREKLATVCASEKMLNVSCDKVTDIIAEQVDGGALIEEMGAVYLPRFYDAEVEVADTLDSMARSHVPVIPQAPYVIRQVIEDSDVTYNEQQAQAIATAVTFPLMVITGGPGTGKTTTLKGIIEVLNALNLSFALCAPTGRAQKRMSEQTGREAKTIHRLLEWSNGGFTRDSSNPLEQEVIICDECSMIDIMLMRSLLRAIKTGGRLIMIGDNDQLPSVGPGRVLGDVIASERVPVIKLQHIYRQQEGSYISLNAADIIHGRMPHIDNKESKDFFFLDVEQMMQHCEIVADTVDEAAQKMLLDIVCERLPAKYPDTEIQVLTPTRQKGECCCNVLNPLLQSRLNANGVPLWLSKCRIKSGDRVMQTSNNYGLQVFNGDVGTAKYEGPAKKKKKKVASWNPWDDNDWQDDGDRLFVEYPDRDEMVQYREEQLTQLDLAYATTIHKSQGSEYPIVVILITPATAFMLNRNLLYTAVTRAKHLCLIIGNRRSLELAVHKVSTDIRCTRLKERLSNCSL